MEGIAQAVEGTVEAALHHNTAAAAAAVLYCQWPTRTVAVEAPTSLPKNITETRTNTHRFRPPDHSKAVLRVTYRQRRP